MDAIAKAEHANQYIDEALIDCHLHEMFDGILRTFKQSPIDLWVIQFMVTVNCNHRCVMNVVKAPHESDQAD